MYMYSTEERVIFVKTENDVGLNQAKGKKCTYLENIYEVKLESQNKGDECIFRGHDQIYIVKR